MVPFTDRAVETEMILFVKPNCPWGHQLPSQQAPNDISLGPLSHPFCSTIGNHSMPLVSSEALKPRALFAIVAN